jgi:hypothetical protein
MDNKKKDAGKPSLPVACPSCRRVLKAARLACESCGAAVEGSFPLPVLARLEAEDQLFAIAFLKSSGSLKDMARTYGVSYPTVRNRLDALIEKVKSFEAGETGRKEG